MTGADEYGSRGAEQPSAALPAEAALPSIFGAIAAGREIIFEYREGRRTCVPRRLSFRNGHWYVAGFDRDRQDERSFRIDRISGPVTVGSEADVHSLLPFDRAPPDE